MYLYFLVSTKMLGVSHLRLNIGPWATVLMHYIVIGPKASTQILVNSTQLDALKSSRFSSKEKREMKRPETLTLMNTDDCWGWKETDPCYFLKNDTPMTTWSPRRTPTHDASVLRWNFVPALDANFWKQHPTPVITNFKQLAVRRASERIYKW